MLLSVLSVCLLSLASAQYYPPIYDLTYYCGSTIFVDREVKVRVRSQTYLNPNQNCTLILRPNRGNRLVASFLGFNLSTSYYYDDSGNCQYESIQLTADGSSQFGYRGYCGYSVPYGQYRLGSINTISVINWQQYSYIYAPNLDIIFTEVSSKYSNNNCPYQMFDCQNYDTCIDDSLKCNGYNDCGNNLDETTGCHNHGPYIDISVNLPAIVGGSVGFVVFVVIIVVTVVICRRRGGKGGYSQF
ncbi:uncharacterized protein LOC106059706 [Biomphalaria glabrata]|uniref:Uncharacterized protein LOC106059706 n=1 Tax=Biomphalaria glabrata TaxID=6526 RepID=A0A9W3A7L2_BIOGL|nr:uncharacterized protein LOC106059706 [Biomphalaria glabrata]XP_055883184.1 uncharacterized protein LOC106059706 [Biomphalaria glabrata]